MAERDDPGRTLTHRGQCPHRALHRAARHRAGPQDVGLRGADRGRSTRDDPVPLRALRRARPGRPLRACRDRPGGTPAFEVRFERGATLPEPRLGRTRAGRTVRGAHGGRRSRWPDHPPYGGTFETVIPHLTVVESEDAPLDADRADRRAGHPVHGRRAERLELWCQDAAGRWRPRWRMPFGVRP